jgi:YggT family protein
MSAMAVIVIFLHFLHWAIFIYTWIFLIYILMSWFPLSENNIFVRILRVLCEPLYTSLLRVLPRLVIGPLDLSPLYFYIFLQILDFVVVQVANRLAMHV